MGQQQGEAVVPPLRGGVDQRRDTGLIGDVDGRTRVDERLDVVGAAALGRPVQRSQRLVVLAVDARHDRADAATGRHDGGRIIGHRDAVELLPAEPLAGEGANFVETQCAAVNSEVVDVAANNLAPQHLVHYLRDLAYEFHTYYNAHTFIVEDDDLRNARLALVAATQQVLRNGLALVGVSAPDSM